MRVKIVTLCIVIFLLGSAGVQAHRHLTVGQATPTASQDATALPPDDEPRPRSTVDETQTVESHILGRAQRYAVYLPPSYATHPERRYPILYLLHGLGNNYLTWVREGDLQAIADRSLAQGESREMIIVCPDGLDTFYCNTYKDIRWEDFFVAEFMPAIESRYRVDLALGRAIAGLSMGGYGATLHAFRRPQLFSSCYAMSGGFLKKKVPQMKDVLMALTPDQWAQLPPYVMECGTEDDLVIGMNYELDSLLTQLGVSHTFIARPGYHEWAFWRECLPKALHFAAKNFRRPE